jgi:hypothetical protein
MTKPYSVDPRKRVAAVENERCLVPRGGAAVRGGGEHSVHMAAAAPSGGSVVPGRIGGHKPKKIAGRHRRRLEAQSAERISTRQSSTLAWTNWHSSPTTSFIWTMTKPGVDREAPPRRSGEIPRIRHSSLSAFSCREAYACRTEIAPPTYTVVIRNGTGVG